MTVNEIIQRFETQVDDATELSSQDELSLLNKVYTDIFTSMAWEFAKKSFTGSINGTTIDLPDDLAFIATNAQYTDVSQNNKIGLSAPKVIYVDNDYYTLVNWSDRRQHQNGNYCWIDLVNGKLEFNRSVSGTVNFDYVFYPTLLGLNDTPAFPSAYHDIIYHGMAVDDYMIQQFDKAKSYAPENQAKYNYWLEKMQMWNFNLQNN